MIDCHSIGDTLYVHVYTSLSARKQTSLLHTYTYTYTHSHTCTLKLGLLGMMNYDDIIQVISVSEGHDALIVSSEDDRYVVVAGTFEKLVEQLACEEKPDPRFVMTFLLGYRHFSTASELLTILLRRYPFFRYTSYCHLSVSGCG